MVFNFQYKNRFNDNSSLDNWTPDNYSHEIPPRTITPQNLGNCLDFYLQSWTKYLEQNGVIE